MSSAIPWGEYAIPLAGAVAACFGMCFHWRDDEHFPLRPIAVLLAILSASMAFGALWYAAFVRPIPLKVTVIEDFGLFFSIFGVALGLKTVRPARWFSVLALLVCGWMCVLFFLEVSTI
jgi:hypothetical protein